jgi:hypothetical protein
MKKFGEQPELTTVSGGWAIFYPTLSRYEVGSRMWSNGGGSIIGYAYNESELQDLLKKAESESAFSKRNAEASGQSYSSIPSGYEISDNGELIEIDGPGFDCEVY